MAILPLFRTYKALFFLLIISLPNISTNSCKGRKWLTSNNIIATFAKCGVIKKWTNLKWEVPASFTFWTFGTWNANPYFLFSLNQIISRIWYIFAWCILQGRKNLNLQYEQSNLDTHIIKLVTHKIRAMMHKYLSQHYSHHHKL